MVLIKRFALILICVLVGSLLVAAQDLESISKLENQIRQLEALVQGAGDSEEVRSLNTDFLTTRRAQLQALLEKSINGLQNYQRATASILTVEEKASLNNEIKRLNEKLDALKSHGGNQSGASTDSETVDTRSDRGGPSLEAPPVSTGSTNPVINSGVMTGASAPPGPSFLLSHPDRGRTDRPTGDFKLSWTKATWATSFTVEVREDQAFGTGGAVIRATVTRSPFTIPKATLEPGKEYYWQVTATCSTVPTADGLYSFSTMRQLGFFNYLSDKGFSLQRVVVGDNESEGASFSFLRTIGEKTVYATDFAYIWNSSVRDQGNTSYSLESSLEGHLTSDDSEAEDALRFATGANIRTRFGRSGLTGLHSTLSAKLEADQRFTTKKLFFEASETFTAIGLPRSSMRIWSQ